MCLVIIVFRVVCCKNTIFYSYKFILIFPQWKICSVSLFKALWLHEFELFIPFSKTFMKPFLLMLGNFIYESQIYTCCLLKPFEIPLNSPPTLSLFRSYGGWFQIMILYHFFYDISFPLLNSNCPNLYNTKS